MATTRKRTSSRSPQKLKSINPRTGEVREEIQAVAPGEVRDIVEQGRKVAPEWAALGPAGRAHHMRKVRYRMYELMDEIVEVVSEECGKPRPEALIHEVMAPMVNLAYLEHLAPKVLRSKLAGPIAGPLFGGALSRIEFRPYGVVGCITPWNFPMQNSFLAFATALFAGNTVVVKPSEVTPACGELLRKILDPLPSGVASIIQGGGDVGAALVEAPCDKISFIGSARTGRLICEAAAKHLTPVVMELGGKDAALVCEDADVDVATSGILWGAFANAGQVCASVERVYVHRDIADEFESTLLQKLNLLQKGAEFGSLTFPPQLEIVRKQIEEAETRGAKVARPESMEMDNENGSLWHAPVVVSDVSEDMTVLREESFGPVLTVVKVNDDDEAVERANEDSVNLTASVWTRDAGRRDRLTDRLKAGTISVNMHVEGAGTPWGTWGGVGESGFGRVNGEPGLREFTLPVHVSRPTVPGKRAYWYPYNDVQSRFGAGVVRFLGSPGIAEKATALRDVVGSYVQTVKTRL